MTLPERPDAFIHVSMQPAPYFRVAPPEMQKLWEKQPGPLELTADEVAWVNEVLGLVCEEVSPGGWVRSDKVPLIAAILEGVFEHHIRDGLLRDNFPRIGWQKTDGAAHMTHELTRRAAPSQNYSPTDL